MRIDRASSADAAALAELAARTFRETFGPENTPSDMESYLEQAFSVPRLRRELEDPASLFLLARAREGDDGGPPVGYAKLRASQSDPAVSGPRPIELERLYVDRVAIGAGVGSALMRESLIEAGGRGHETLWLGVWESNERAIAFYRRWRFEEVGDHLFQLGGDLQRDLIMQRAVP